MSTKLLIKNLNVKEIEKNATKELSQINLSSNVNELVEKVANVFQINPLKLDLLYRGELMERNRILNDYLKDSTEAGIILVENKANCVKEAETVQPSEKDIQELSHRLGTTFKSKRKRRQLESYLKNAENIQNVCKQIPGLNQDPISYSFIHSTELILQLGDLNKAKSLIKTYPNIFHATKLLYRLVGDEIKSNPLNANAVSKGSFSIDDMSDEEEGQQAQASNRRTNSTGPAISQDHLSAVLAALNQQQQQQAQQQQSQRSSFSRDHFQSVMQNLLNQSLTNTPHSVSSPPAATTASVATTATPQPSASVPQNVQQTNPNLTDEQLAACLEKMHEFGFWEDDRNMRALFITEGNVEAAISLLVEGVDF